MKINYDFLKNEVFLGRAFITIGLSIGLIIIGIMTEFIAAIITAFIIIAIILIFKDLALLGIS